MPVSALYDNDPVELPYVTGSPQHHTPPVSAAIPQGHSTADCSLSVTAPSQ